MIPLTELLQGSPFLAYTYAYPHKHAYRPFAEARPLASVWQGEKQSALFLYIHIPFCEIRCGFCNLFTTVRPQQTVEQAYIQAVWQQAVETRAALPEAKIAQMAIGGGTPTYLTLDELGLVLDIPEKLFQVELAAIPVSVETSPATAELEKLLYLRQRGINRISIGIQSFVADELKGLGRPQRQADVTAALHNIRRAGFPTLNIDLIYGGPEQTVQSWLYSIKSALVYEPEELFLYPLYVRSLTGLDKLGRSWDEQRWQLYHEGRSYLLAEGYEQLSLRFFRRRDHAPQQSAAFRCQEDGMIGLGCGARSYTRQTHYSSEYAVGRSSIRAILADWIRRPPASFTRVDYGYQLNGDEQRRRFVLKSLLHRDGLDKQRFEQIFGRQLYEEFPQLGDLESLGLAQQMEGRLCLTPDGLGWSDVIGPWLYSEAVQQLTQSFDLR